MDLVGLDIDLLKTKDENREFIMKGLLEIADKAFENHQIDLCVLAHKISIVFELVEDWK